MLWLNLIIVIVLIALSALFSGLTLGLMSLNKFVLKRKVRMGNKNAKKIYPLRRKGNLLLCTLLLGNVAVNSVLSIFLGSLTAGVIAAFMATGLIVIFGEILPQAFFARHALRYGAKFTSIVWVFLIILYPITKPISMVLDHMLGGEIPTAYSKRELRMFLAEQTRLKQSEIDNDDYEILRNSLYFSDLTVRSIMTPLKNCFFLERQRVLDNEAFDQIHASGHSRIPIYDGHKQKVVGILFTKDLVTKDVGVRVDKIMRKQVRSVKGSHHLDDVLRMFQNWRIHMCIVRDSNNKVVGIVTLEDVLEEIIGEVVDEHDRYVDMREPIEEVKRKK